MKTKLIKNLFKFFILILIIITVFGSYKVYAEEGEETETGSEFDEYKPTLNNDRSLLPKAGKLLGYINVIGAAISIIAVVAVGIKYLTGSVEERAEYKKTASTYLIGAFLLFSVSTIPNILYNIGLNFSGYEEEVPLKFQNSINDRNHPEQFIK